MRVIFSGLFSDIYQNQSNLSGVLVILLWYIIIIHNLFFDSGSGMIISVT